MIVIPPVTSSCSLSSITEASFKCNGSLLASKEIIVGNGGKQDLIACHVRLVKTVQAFNYLKWILLLVILTNKLYIVETVG